MGLTFKKPVIPAPQPGQTRTLCFPGETRKAILEGKRFGIYSHRTKREQQYRVQPGQHWVFGFDKDEEVPLGYLGLQEDGSLHFHQQRVDHPMYTSLSIIFDRGWKLLEQGCRLHPDNEWRLYE